MDTNANMMKGIVGIAVKLKLVCSRRKKEIVDSRKDTWQKGYCR